MKKRGIHSRIRDGLTAPFSFKFLSGKKAAEAPGVEASLFLAERLKGMEQTLAEGRERMQRIEALLASLLAASGAGRGGRRAPVAAR
eukprot:tig00022099_g23803.t1